jgi:hypothetical protein
LDKKDYLRKEKGSEERKGRVARISWKNLERRVERIGGGFDREASKKKGNDPLVGHVLVRVSRVWRQSEGMLR